MAEYLITNHMAIFRGDIIYFPKTITSTSKMNALYVSLPFYFDNSIQSASQNGKTVIFPLLIPIYEKEAELIHEKGWDSFESFLEDNQINNLWDLQRKCFDW